MTTIEGCGVFQLFLQHNVYGIPFILHIIVLFPDFFEYEEKIFLKIINWLAFLIEIYVFSVKCELKSEII
jgi:hypothetical protein